jgi:heme o synthase
MSTAKPQAAPVAATASRFQQFYSLTKPRVIQLIVFCALIGMVLSVPGAPTLADVQRAAIACFGIWLVAGAAAVFNCLVEQGIDAKMRGARQRKANLATGRRCCSRRCSARSAPGCCMSGSIR